MFSFFLYDLKNVEKHKKYIFQGLMKNKKRLKNILLVFLNL